MEHATFKDIVLEQVDFGKAVLNNARFLYVEIEETDFREAILNKTKFKNSRLYDVDLRRASLQKTSFRDANLTKVDFSRSDLRGISLHDIAFESVSFAHANLKGTKLTNLDLRRTGFSRAILVNVNFRASALDESDFRIADLRGTRFVKASLRNADLRGAALSDASFYQTDIHNAKLDGADVRYMRYEPISVPHAQYLTGINGIVDLWFEPGAEASLVRLRNLAGSSGYPRLERQATYAIRETKSRHMRASVDWANKIGGAADLVLFGWTVGWGLFPSRALWIMLTLIGISISFYAAILAFPIGSRRHGIVRVWEEGRVRQSAGEVAVARSEVAELIPRREVTGWRRLVHIGLWAMYFSLLSTFHIGWRDFNLGAWLVRIQFRQYRLVGTGIVRAWAGVQSLVCVFLLALFAFTYFGRPFN